MSFWKKSSIGATAALALMLAACGSTDKATEKEQVPATDATVENKEEHTQEEASKGTRFIVTHEGGLVVLDAKFEELQRYATGATSVGLANDLRHVVVKDSVDKDSYTILDSGVWYEPHGDHGHSYAETPVLAEFERTASKPAHIVSHAGKTAVFHDGSGLVEVFDKVSATENTEPLFTYEGAAHHGVAVPLSDGTLAASYQTETDASLPGGVKIVDDHGQEVALITDKCNGLHGTAYVGDGDNEQLAFGCIGQVITYQVATKTTTEIALPNPEARVGTAKMHEDSEYFVTNYSEGDTPKTKLGIINRSTNELAFVELPAAYGSSFFVAPNNLGYVLAENGVIYEINLQTASISLEVQALDAFDLKAEGTLPYIVLVQDSVLVVDAANKTIAQVHGDHVHPVATLNVTPTSILAVNAY